ncbi:MAG: aminotransferase class I/II-fold pyridoxal phosphate-dependent enzyme [Ruminococcaceae bacterium]|nr:aminotransferase class I/II-fold pyridoxal phosphate-dependent enzyme [Oscillospiraceae bacterium]
MINFGSDYLEGAHPEILNRLLETNFEQSVGYGEDNYCLEAAEIIRKLCKNEDADVHFLIGGTGANLTVMAAALRPHHAVIAPVSGHISVHESGAIEATGHKVIELPSTDGKMTAKQIFEVCNAHHSDVTHEHMAKPAMVYLTLPTECGTVYTLSELREIFDVCRQFDLLLYVDGARLGTALVCDVTDITLPDLAKYSSAFTIGGTKLGALFGEAVVVIDSNIKKDFRYIIKQRGGMLAKGRLLGVQFKTLFENGLYFDIAKHEVMLAQKLRRAFEDNGWELLFDSPTNQQFPIIPDNLLSKLSEKYGFSHWEKVSPDKTAVRFCTSWATNPEHVDELIAYIKSL